jgi:hypothetical protein
MNVANVTHRIGNEYSHDKAGAHLHGSGQHGGGNQPDRRVRDLNATMSDAIYMHG